LLKNSKRERQSESHSTLASDSWSLCFTHRNHAPLLSAYLTE
jgi:hypothetical protein